MHLRFGHDHNAFEVLPSILIQRCLGQYFIYLAWGTFYIEIELR